MPPASVCVQLEISLAAVAAAIESDTQFRSLLDRVQQLLSQNVVAALYKAAMEGNVTAQQFYLKNRPPPEWPNPDAKPDSTSLDSMTNEELADRLQRANALFLPELVRRSGLQAGEGIP